MSSNGGGRSVIITLSDYPGFKLYHYEAGTATLKNLYSDENLQTTVAQPLVADSKGVVQFWALGDYKFVIDDANDVTKYTWDDQDINKGQSFIQATGTAYPAASAANKGMGFAKIDGSNVVRGIGISNGTSFVEIYRANASGTQVIDDIITKAMPVYNVLHSDWGAIGDGTTDDTTAVQAAITEIAAQGAGVLYFPRDYEFRIVGKLTITNTSIKIMGDGAGQSIVKFDVADGGFDYDTASILDRFVIEGLTISTTNVAGGDAINCAWSAGATENTNFTLTDVEIIPDSSGGEYWTNGCVISNASYNAKISGYSYRGAGSRVSTSGITMTGDGGYDGDYVDIINCAFFNVDKAILISANSIANKITNCNMEEVNYGVHLNYAANQSGQKIIGNHIDCYEYGVLAEKCTDSIFSDNTIHKNASSTDNWIGIDLNDTMSDSIVDSNVIRDLSSAGTSIGISLTSGTDVLITSNKVADARDEGIHVAANINDFTINNNNAEGCATGIEVAAGSSDDYIIQGNKLTGNTSNITDGGTGVNKRVTGNITDTSGTVASAASIIPPDDVEILNVTGTTNISTITKLWTDRKLTLTGTAGANFQVVTGGNIKLNGGAAAVLNSVSDSVSLICNPAAGGWLEMGRCIN